MVQIYGIDLASQKFDVSFVGEKGEPIHRVVKNARPQIEKFLDSLPDDAWIVAEHTGVYGDLLLMLADMRGIRVSYVPGYEIKHSMGLTRGKSDEKDAHRIREYGERHLDRLVQTHFPASNIYRLKELHATRRLLVRLRKQTLAMTEADRWRPMNSDKASDIKAQTLDFLDKRIAELEAEMEGIISNDPELARSAAIIRSVPGVGRVTSVQLIIKTGNFKRVKTAKKCATLAGIAPFPNSTGKSDRGSRISPMGDRELKTLLFMCARTASIHFKEFRLYRQKKLETERKHYFLVLNNLSNKLIKIVYALIRKDVLFDPTFVCVDPRKG